MELKPQVEIRQQLALSPNLYQSLKILRLSASDLMTLVQAELNENPTLEMPEPWDFDTDLSHGETGQEAPVELWRDLAALDREVTAPGRRDPLRSGAISAIDLAASPVTLSDHLTLQLDLLRLGEDRRQAALAVIGNLDEDGYLREPAGEIAMAINMPVEKIEEAVSTVQGFDPPGIGARNLEECLTIQLKQMNAGNLAKSIVREHLDQVAKGAFKDIAKELRVNHSRVERAVAIIHKLDPSPGSLFDTNPPAAPVIPDVFVKSQHGKISILANREIMPSLRVGRLYRQIVEEAKTSSNDADNETVKYIKAKIRKASRLIRDIEQRRATVTRVARAIADAQPDFFEKGPGYLRPLSLDDIASILEVHPSTVSRAILGKYMSTPRGIFEFRYFFSSGYAAAGEGGLAATAVKKRLKKLIDAEDQRRPLSDQKLTDLFQQEDIPISRRTVTKYREEMSIPSSWIRKRQISNGF